MKSVLECHPDDDLAGTMLKDAFEVAWVRFAHFVQAGSDNGEGAQVVSIEMAWLAMRWGIGIQRAFRHASMHIVIPVLLSGKDEKMVEKKMTAILVSVKNKSDHATLGSLKADPSLLGFLPKAVADHRPIISLVM
ncbi:hypothetical protein FRB94_002523 [Tulasnella sp. JGI-2019a]|nr:hypothetical protein FRB93_010171 [Tulasnella sp. JGI-2019a]KAG9013449.1 hypothetical protein FRB94_002523 [Tulasnella sp. JGI-2019a]